MTHLDRTSDRQGISTYIVNGCTWDWLGVALHEPRMTQQVIDLQTPFWVGLCITKDWCLRGAWRDRDTNDIFAHCSLISYFLDFKFSNFICLSELHPLIWFFFKNSFRKKKYIRKTSQNALAPSIFIVLSIALKLGTPLLHTQAQNTLLQNFQFRSRSWDMNKKPPKTLFYPTRSALMKHNFFRRSKLKNL